ncbi:phage tail terminator protein [Photobacterium sanguinicancri]|uniref:Uncharacterized protein n=1 Tax=Photobacterium sanguinicancri TaxID=875932 RepID=A0AAW7Y379_9GAMM|nr:hypothetical protein [Photobacterium sanguinicancri]MDO6542817.1 hypothetical protein [Photobacterium sanguinicancri]
MADLIKLTVKRLKSTVKGKPPWIDVHELDSLTQLDLKRSKTVRTPSLYVFQVGDSPQPDVRGSGAYLQTVTVTVGVVIVDASSNSKPLNWKPLRDELKKRLFGWSGDDEFEPYWLGSGRLLAVESGRATWLDQFVTEYTEDQNSYGS